MQRMTASPHLAIVFVTLVILAGCRQTGSTSEPSSIAPQFTQPTPDVQGLVRSPTFVARPSITPSPSTTPNQTQIVFDQTKIVATQSYSALQTKEEAYSDSIFNLDKQRLFFHPT